MMRNNLYDFESYHGYFSRGFDSLSFSPEMFLGLSAFGLILTIFFIISVALKGYALWTASKRDEKWWFIILLFVNTMGILEIIYLVAVAKVSFARKGVSEEEMDETKENTKKETE